ncbi:MAG: TetR family transcriptional regulator C-terminal domain-containing protein [Actinobacteria bacterium]|nr:TetR family transcriptional regulator C-terminal domain-containing protein [Actinomycetota bacterium]MBO0784767.1 TetR family transcriptional regulator C-terminal domain-containing protein [Actinomycetota bacterium]
MSEQAGAVVPQAGTAGTADQRREQMLRAALEVITERGYAETRIADVAERAGTSPALVIYYFKTKDQLLTEAIRYAEDYWYEAGTRRMAELPTAAARLAEIVSMSFLAEEPDDPGPDWLLWLDLWAQAARHSEVASVRQKFDERWRETIRSLVLAGQETGEFGPVDAADFALVMSALLDGLAIQVALADPAVNARRAFELCMRFAAGQLGFSWDGSPPAGG